MLKFFLSLFFFISAVCRADYQYNLSICAIFQNEGPFLKEWIDFHRLVGVEHFYLINHNSEDNYLEILQPYISSGLVELTNKTTVAKAPKEFNTLQCNCYNECLKKSKGMSKWVAFVDIDEFLFPTHEDNLSKVLEEYEEFGGVVANWLVFGPSHIWEIPSNQLLIETLTLCSDKKFSGNYYVKSIVRPERVSQFENPHQPIYQKGCISVNTDKLPLEEMWSTYYRVNKLRINHYWTRHGNYFYHQKLERHKQWRGDPDPEVIKPFIESLNVSEDKSILRFVPLLKEMMNNSKT